MGKTKYPEVLRVARGLNVEDVAPKSEILKSVFSSLRSNVARMTSLAILPSFLTDTSYRAQYILCLSMYNITGKIGIEIDEETKQKINSERQRIYESLANSVINLIDFGNTGENPTDTFEAASINLEHALDNAVSIGPKDAFRALYSGLILASYSALESLSADLWLISVNARPKSLAMNVLLPTQKIAANPDRPQKNQEPTIALAELGEKYGFNVSACMGDVLKLRGQVSFESIYNVRDAYFRAYRNPDHPQKKVSNTLEQLFQSSLPDIKMLEAIRNLIAHRGGVIDRRFREDIKDFSPDLHSLEERTELPIDGTLVCKSMLSSIKFSKSLLKFVDDWLHMHLDKE